MTSASFEAEISQVKAEDWDDKDETLKATMMETIQTVKEPRQVRCSINIVKRHIWIKTMI